MPYCRNCGRELAEEFSNCPDCGCPKGLGVGFCENCGEQVIPGTVYCARCGAPVVSAPPQPQPVAPAKIRKPRSRWAAAAFGIVMGAFGVHNFYLGHTGRGIAQIAITVAVYANVCSGTLPQAAAFLLAGLWGFIEGVLIAVGESDTDAEGKPLLQWNQKDTDD